MADSILLVDDDPDILEAVSLALEIENISSVCAQDVALAYELLESREQKSGHHGISAIVTDYYMHGGTGIELIKKVRESKFSNIPFILISGNAAKLQETLDEWIPEVIIEKPFLTKDLVEAIRKVTTK